MKIPAILHLTRLGYHYLPLKHANWDPQTNICTELFRASLLRINPDASPDDIERLLQELASLLDFEDLGKAFHGRLLRTDGIRLIDFENFDNNSFHVVTELPCRNGEDEFRPDITLLINGMPLFFMEVKKPNNREGILAERNRINRRFRNPKFRRFINITQLMVFSNNMEFAEASPEPLEGAYYATTARDAPSFNYFREEENRDLGKLLAPLDPETEDLVLADNNLPTIRHTQEYSINLSLDTPTNRLATSLFSPDRLALLLRFAFAYVKGSGGVAKHVMRYPQIFATMAIGRMLEQGKRAGEINPGPAMLRRQDAEFHAARPLDGGEECARNSPARSKINSDSAELPRGEVKTSGRDQASPNVIAFCSQSFQFGLGGDHRISSGHGSQFGCVCRGLQCI